jgi:hypothetical protein
MSKDFTVKINRKSVKFGLLGHRFRMQAAEKIRECRAAAFKDFVGGLPADPAAMITQTNVALDTYMSGIIVGDEDVNKWAGTPEGLYFAFGKSILKANPKMEVDESEELYDNLDREGMAKLRDFWMTALQGSVWSDLMERALITITENLKDDKEETDKAESEASAKAGAGD